MGIQEGKGWISVRPVRQADRNIALDGLRGVAALAVLWSHLIVHLGLMPVPPLGGMGVLVFFALSGYLIARIVVRRASRQGAYRAFLRRRAVRLGPVILAVSVFGPLLLVATHSAEPRSALAQGFVALTQTTACATVLGLDVHPVLAPTWSLTVEWTFYLLFPGAVLLLLRRGRSLLALARAAALSAAVLYASALLLEPKAFYLLPLANLAPMMLGAALGLAHEAGWVGPERIRRGPWPWAAAIIIVAFVFLPGYPLGWGYKLSVFPATAVSTVVIISACVAGHPIGRVLGSRALSTVGVRAYSLYLWHMAVLWTSWFVTQSATWATAGIACLALVPGVEVSYRAREGPVLGGGSSALRSRSAPSLVSPPAET